MSVLALIGLAAGGAIGSGWFSPSAVPGTKDTVWALIIGGAIMAAVAIVMVELSILVPTTGGLIFSPLQSSGPFVAIVVAAALWLAYALNSAAEAVFMANQVGFAYKTNYGEWLGITVLFMGGILAINLAASSAFIKFNTALTIFKITVPLLVIIFFAQNINSYCAGGGASAPRDFLGITIGGGVVFAYTGFQAPMDFAGNIREHGVRRWSGLTAATRLRLAVYLTVSGLILLYILLQLVFHNAAVAKNCTQSAGAYESPYLQHASQIGHGGWKLFDYALWADAFLSPLGAGMVYSYALNREVAALSRARLTTRGLQSRIWIFGKPYNKYGWTLGLNLFLGFIAVLSEGRDWKVLTSTNSVLSLFAYAVLCIVLIAILPQVRETSCGTNRRKFYKLVAWVGFAGAALVIYASGWETLVRSMLEFSVGCALLLGLPSLARWDPPGIGWLLRRYDAREYGGDLWSMGKLAVGYVVSLGLLPLARFELAAVDRFRRDYADQHAKVLRTRDARNSWYAVVAAMELVGFLAVVALLGSVAPLLRFFVGESIWTALAIPIYVLVAGTALLAFELIVKASEDYIKTSRSALVLAEGVGREGAPTTAGD